MKLLSKIIFVVSAVLFLNSFVNAQDCKSKVTIKTDMDSSLIFVNNKFVGRGKINLELNKGAYKIFAKEPIDVWDARVITDSINIANCDEKKIEFKFNNLLYLQTDPTDADVYAGDSLIGHSPMFIPPHETNLILKKPNYKELPVTLNTKSNNRIYKLNYIGEPNKVSFFKKNMFKFFVGGIVALGAVSAYFKLKADDKFRQYQNTGDNSMLDQTRKYDLISGISFGALQINFGLLIYYFLTD
ncbi:MAG: hypothetical protein M1480_19940 [Bacteroidetes bacterium]|nr:hypothetical protein [Bacteroidota bacterium]